MRDSEGMQVVLCNTLRANNLRIATVMLVMMSRTSAVRLIGSVILMTVLLAGCSDEPVAPSPTGTNTTSPSPTATFSPSPSPTATFSPTSSPTPSPTPTPDPEVLVVSVESTNIGSYDSDGYATVHLVLGLENRSDQPFSQVEVGVVCPDGRDCPGNVEFNEVPPGASEHIRMELRLQQGASDIIGFLRVIGSEQAWTDDAAFHVTIDVPAKQPLDYALGVRTSLLGYWSDGTASVEATMTLENSGYQPRTHPVRVTVACYRHNDLLTNCGEQTAVSLPDGYGPTDHTLPLRVPMGVTLQAWVEGSDGGPQQVFKVPERILGVDRDVWGCFSDRPGQFTYEAEGDRIGGCGGWALETVRKWAIDQPVKVWADPAGEDLYIDILRDTLTELSRLMNLEFQWVTDKKDAQLKAYVGIPPNDQIASCTDSGGCAWKDSASDNVIEDASFTVWKIDDAPDDRRELLRAKGITMHEALHALADMVHRKQLSSIMGNVGFGTPPQMNRMDRDLVTLYSHPLIRPGMHISKVAEIVVFADDLLDPPIDPYATARGIWQRLIAAPARFTLRISKNCDNGDSYPLEWGTYERYVNKGAMRFYNDDTDVIKLPETPWPIWTGNDVKDKAVANLDPFADPGRIAEILSHTYRDAIQVEELSSGDLLLQATVDSGFSITNRITATVAPGSFELRSYDFVWRDGLNDCSYEVEAVNGEYEFTIDVPSIAMLPDRFDAG